IGELDTGASAVSIPVLDQKGILQVSPADGLAGLTRKQGATRGEPEKYYPDPRRNFVRVVPPDNRQAAALAAYMKELGVTRLYVVNDGSGYGGALAGSVVVDGAALGVGVVANETITPQGADYAGAARRIMRAGPDANDRRRAINGAFGVRRSDAVVGPYSIGPAGDATLRSFGAYRVQRGRLVFDRLLTAPGP